MNGSINEERRGTEKHRRGGGESLKYFQETLVGTEEREPEQKLVVGEKLQGQQLGR